MQLPASAYGLAEFKHAEHSVMLPDGFKYEDLLQRESWAHIASRLRPHDIIHVRDARMTIYARLYVLAADRLWAIVREIERIGLEDASEASEEDGLFVDFRGKAKWSVIRSVDNVRVKDGFQSRILADEWLADHREKTGQKVAA